jgi:endonuclease/exonuclease/phosphatase family metal-dependent hydrolase
MAEPFRIVSYNVRYFGHALRGLASTRTGKRSIARAIASMTPLPHIVCLQEVETSSLRSTLAFRPDRPEETQLESFMAELERAFDELERPFRYEAFYFRAHANRIGTRALSTMGLAVVVDTKALRVDHHNASEPHPITHHHVQRFKDRKQARICAHLRVTDRRGRPLHVFNTHLSLPTPFAKEFWTGPERMGFGINQLHEARRLAAFIRSQADGEPLVVCGDFNSPPGSPVYRFLTEDVGLVGVQNALGQICGKPREFPTAGFLSLRMHLDHLFCNTKVRWLDLDGTLPFGDRRNPFHGKSDHVPLIGRFEIDGA